jgi:hypothetical protein
MMLLPEVKTNVFKLRGCYGKGTSEVEEWAEGRLKAKKSLRIWYCLRPTTSYGDAKEPKLKG